ncbi:hypothetical protein Clacol_005515 [Clathrus columnatus]|uniref:CCZ1/INTU/HSP4 first Longin domain-containing protein n=1 Tax=Clathrus columnatus TaxID=1419009 RepID=A0AAV5ACT5_9AGAM|nr:hypothetical protein Clacol_005515 [Clathrus columnatus]
MNAKVLPSLAYFLIYNPTISLPENAEIHNDEDAREEAHILFYTSQDQVTSKDRMLRQVGLAKAIVTFTELFTPNNNSDNIHTQSKRMVSVSPEPDFWMHICVNLAKTQKTSKRSKETDNNALSDTYYYYPDSVPDTVLHDCLLRGYQEFKLFHGSLSSILPTGQLQRQLERFFTPWAWQLDFETLNDMRYRPGPKVHPLSLSLRPTITDFTQTLPPDSLLILLTSSHLVTSPEEERCPPSLLNYLWSISRTSDLEATNNAKQETRTPEDSLKQDRKRNTTTSSLFGSGIESMMNMKKWTWPESLTFGKTTLSGTSQSHASEDVISSEPGPKTQPKNEMTSSSTSPTDDDGVSSVLIDQLALDDAIATSHGHLLSVNEDGYIPLTSTDHNDSNAFSLFATSSTCFTAKRIFISTSQDASNSQPRQLLYTLISQSLFALVVDVTLSQESNRELLGRLFFNATRFLTKIEKVLEDNKSLKHTSSRKSDYVLRLRHNSVYADGDITKEGYSYLTEHKELMQNDEDIQEIFSRPQIPKAWFVSKRGVTLNPPNYSVTEADFAINVKEASLVGANNEIESIVRYLNKR